MSLLEQSPLLDDDRVVRISRFGKSLFPGVSQDGGWTQPWPLKLQNLSLSAIILVHSLASKVPRYDSEVVSTLNLCN
ncbi:unnamed protein product [Camellia sinensis]